MKVLSIREPYDGLICTKKKTIETRSWKTDYRGELFIHASAASIANKLKENVKFMKLIENISLKPGHILCKCKLVDCIYMTKEYVENIKNNNHQEYICGEYKAGRYGWVLEDIVALIEPILAKGQLNIWNYYSEVK